MRTARPANSPKKGEKKRNPWSDSDASDDDIDGSDLSDAVDGMEVSPRERAGGRRAAASKAKFKFVSSLTRINSLCKCFVLGGF